MIITIENEYLSATINSFGAELTELKGKQDGIRYICPEANSEWEGISPVLFPNAGLIRKSPVIGGREWLYRKHGFARDMEFSASEVTPASVCLELYACEETRAIFPFDFRLSITYSLENSTLAIKTEIENTGSVPMPYSLGFHPGFSCPLVPEEKAEDYELVFPCPATASRLNLESGYVASKTGKYLNGETALSVCEGMFDGGSYTLTDLNFRSITLRSSVSGAAVRVDFPDFPNLVIWGPRNKPVSTVCMEPWHAQADRLEGEPDIFRKPFVLINEPGESRKLSFSITAGT